MKIEYILDRDIFDESIRKIAGGGIVIDVGAAKPFHKKLSAYKGLFKNTAYYAMDICYYPELDIIGDAQTLPFKEGCASGVICYSVIEMVVEPWRAVKEIYRILKPGGEALIWVPFLHPYRSDNKTDCYRFSKDAIIYIFRDFSQIMLQPEGGYVNVALNFITGFKLTNFFNSKFERAFCRFLEKAASLIIKKKVNRLHNTN